MFFQKSHLPVKEGRKLYIYIYIYTRSILESKSMHAIFSEKGQKKGSAPSFQTNRFDPLVLTPVTRNWALAHESWMVRRSPHAPEISRGNKA